ncbi:PAS domain-containing sensor histidine kinase [Cellulophaga sp. F20128]|uniref:sensor histidine kinase n=1 Tax=Cellulophaga sp. F20128 TaxID=2926413 RepID=UPI001FF36DA7|nr:PAS domain-containing sensor histidine kinase [Cellulophaga sp. F20128]MCK0158239.1 PAS domain-containing sensor histidine kinase [Cellulophaga sp. F20128]
MANEHKDTTSLREAFFNNTQETLAIFDKDLNFVDANEALLRILRLKRDQIVGKNVTEISPGIEVTKRYEIYKEVLKTGIPVVIDEVRLHPSLGNYMSRVSIFKVGDYLGLSAVNITDLKEATDELETYIYKVSHDMRRPIASVLGLINAADYDMKSLETAKDYLLTIKQETERLDTILLKLVETMSIRQGKKTIHLIDFCQVIKSVLKSLEYMNQYDEIRFEQNISTERKFYSDKSLIISLMENLLDNTIKYKKENNKDSYVKISVEDENGGVKIMVTDNGIGIPTNLQKDVFKMFFRATHQASGSGLGLYTVRHTVKVLGGTIKFDSSKNIGTVFTIYLPSEKVYGRAE